MFLGIEIGGTKLQLGVGRGRTAELVELERFDVAADAGAEGILARILAAAPPLIVKYGVERVGIGFGGPVDAAQGKVVVSHQIDGWANFPLAQWCRDKLGPPAVLGNDADLAALAEARWGAGQGRDPVFYVTIGTGIGGGLIVGGQVYRGSGVGAAEIGHLRPGLHADRAEETIESVASGWGISSAAQAYLAGPIAHQLGAFRAGSKPLKPELVRQHLIETEEAVEEQTADLWRRCDGDPERLTAKVVAEAAAEQNDLAREVLLHAWDVLGWGLAQMITLLSPAVVVIGGGVSLIGEELLFKPLRTAVNRYVFPPFLGTFEIVPARLGEEMVVHGALALAGDRSQEIGVRR
ncbi:MAG TPA: ROK family protein [Pirellulales bacterium]|jgi:glucokinase|nr:ROK family protein [Pirellulales bacterium]